MLFDDIPEKTKKAKKKAADPQGDGPTVEPWVLPAAPMRPIGRTDGIHECYDERCLGDTHDIIEEWAGSWLLECVFCGTKQRARAIKGYIKPQSDRFVFRAGDYAGMSLEDVWATSRGRAYIEWAAAEHSSQEVKDACKKHIDAISAAT